MFSFDHAVALAIVGVFVGLFTNKGRDFRGGDDLYPGVTRGPCRFVVNVVGCTRKWIYAMAVMASEANFESERPLQRTYLRVKTGMHGDSAQLVSVQSVEKESTCELSTHGTHSDGMELLQRQRKLFRHRWGAAFVEGGMGTI